ncbi:MAG TPA: hypothetical protein VHR55_03960 [Candidatus Limnocylindria bacterium]|nr:hypothetical protein [Candidatus Limnocylindria bacterium]
MPAAAYALLGLFASLSVACGVGAARLVGPWRPWAPLLPSLSAFGALWLVGHRLGISLGPEVSLFGFRVAIVLDVAVAVLAALAGAILQRGLLALLDLDQRRPGRDGLA